MDGPRRLRQRSQNYAPPPFPVLIHHIHLALAVPPIPMNRYSSTSSAHSRYSYGQQQGAAGGGFGRPRPGPPPGADPTLWSWFTAVDTDGWVSYALYHLCRSLILCLSSSNAISPEELQRALVNGNMTRSCFLHGKSSKNLT